MTLAIDRPWEPHERNYSGGRFGVWHSDKWTMLRVEAGIADATASITEGEAWDLALRLSPAVAKRLDYLFTEMRKAQQALHQFTWADTLSPLLRKIADEWDCDSSQCEFASSDMGGLSCPHIEGEQGCRAVEASELRQFADALEYATSVRGPKDATEAEAEAAIAALESAIEAARNSNQAGENAVVRAAAALTKAEER